jgi:hypothetical protein
MRLALTGLLAAGVLAAGAAAAAPCTSAVDQGAFDIAGLKSQLMVTALSCDMRDQYNAFIQRFRPDLVREERALNAYFARAYGRRARQAHDDYITNLANVQSEAGVQRGTLFCKEHVALFDSVMAIRNVTQLVQFAAHQPLPQPVLLVSCSVRQPVTKKPQGKYTRTAERR